MAALGRQFLTINSTALPETSKFSIDIETKEKVFETEDGHDNGIMVRAGKHKFSVAWEGATDAHKDLCETYCAAGTVSLLFNGTTYICRARNLKEEMVRYSNRYSGSAGLWNISFDLSEV